MLPPRRGASPAPGFCRSPTLDFEHEFDSVNGNGQGPSSSAERLREQAVALRRAGRSRREIKEFLGIGSNQTLNEALHGEPPPEWTRRPRAKDTLHARARELREQGLGYDALPRH
ncbi:MAG: hypothetical protein ACR2MP_16825 [Streptosporangiaceae bacterium]